MPRLGNTLQKLALAAACASATAAGAQSVRLGLDAEYTHERNVNRAALGKEEQSDDTATVEAYAARSILLSDHSGLVLRAALRGTEFFRFSDLSNVGVSGRVAWRVQPWLGYTNPWFELAGQVDGFKYRDSDIRDGYEGAVNASVGKYFTDRIRTEIGIGYDRRGGGSGDLYDLSNRKAWAALDYRITQRAVLYGSGTWMRGGQVFTLFNTAPWAALYSSATAEAPDPAFSSAFHGAAPTAYRMDARTARYELGVNYAIAGNHAVDLGWSRFDSRAEHSGGTYSGDTIRAGYLYRFR